MCQAMNDSGPIGRGVWVHSFLTTGTRWSWRG